jgi:beta-barrel assembly-enhancing protease
MPALGFEMSGWPATYFDGSSAVRHTVTVANTPDGIAFTSADVPLREWPARDYRLHVAPGRSHIRFEHQPYCGEAIQVDDPAAIAALLAGNSLGVSRPRHLIALAVLCAAVVAGVYVSVPYAIALAARLVPRAVEQRLGRVVAASLAPPEKHVDLDALARPVLDRVFAAAGPEWTYNVTWLRTREVNALAAPGGQLVVYCGLVRELQSAEEFAAILAHEVTHVTERHSIRNLLRTMGVRMALSLFGGADVLLDTAAMLGTLHYMRADEESADLLGQRLLVRAELDPEAMARAFSRLEHDGVAIPAWLSSHPATTARKERAAEFARKHADSRRTPLMSDADWSTLQSACATY